ncbi:MAG: CvpA family protein [Desulfobacterales bacterium]|uniref:CvpA family protein n=1 Tax=Candidatus Desulfatibia vada TaxID=2841696 RepID=A0A8J6P5T9_9BACT|nr:CvpA family protein [Candidatus Desulfatibia vada]MBL6970622.1 CvpA family protein [Desulfobacterales bacterium]
MNLFDIAILITVGGCLIAGIIRGPFKELFSISGFYLGTFAAFNYSMKIERFLSSVISNTVTFKALSFLIVFCEIYIIIIILGAIIRYFLKIEPSGWPDHFLGATMGTFKGILIVAIALIIITVISPKGDILLKKSIFSPRLAMVSEAMVEIASGEIQDEFADKLADLKKTWKL